MVHKLCQFPLCRRDASKLHRIREERCIIETEVAGVLFHCHSSNYAGIFATFKIVSKALQI